LTGREEGEGRGLRKCNEGKLSLWYMAFYLYLVLYWIKKAYFCAVQYPEMNIKRWK